jgi:hypothetical protein
MLEDLNMFATMTTAVFLEAAPFLLIGSLLGVLFETYMPADRLERLTPKSTPGRVLVGVFAGLLIPTCECGVVSIVRKMLKKGVPPTTAIPYMMCAPVINPVVLASTYVAFQGDYTMLLWRILMVLVPATGLGLALDRIPSQHLLKGNRLIEEAPSCGCGHACCAGHDSAVRPGMVVILARTGAEFVELGKYLALGAMASAAFKVFTPPAAMEWFARSPWLAVAGMMGLAIVLSICSEADAFVAASFSFMPRAAQAAFVGVGPMVDLKLIAMFSAVFNRRITAALVIVPTVAVFVLAMVMQGVGG